MPGTTITLDSDPGDWILAGDDQVLSGPGWTITGVVGESRIAIQAYRPEANFQLEFSTPTGVAIAHPARYGGIEGFVSSSGARPSLNVSGNHRGCNRVLGWFQILEIEVGAAGELLKLALDFVQLCEGYAGGLYGAVRINSDVSSGTTSPRAIVPNVYTKFGNELVHLEGAMSFQRPAAGELSYQWIQRSGPVVELQGADTPTASFVAPYVPPGGEEATFDLIVEDAAGLSDTATTRVRILSKTDPLTGLFLDSDPGELIAQGRTYYLLPSDGIIQASSYRGGVAFLFSGDYNYRVTLVPPPGTPFVPGDYENAGPIPLVPSPYDPATPVRRRSRLRRRARWVRH